MDHITLTQTARTSTPGQANIAGDGRALSGGNGVFSAGSAGLNFFDLIFGRITATQGAEIAADKDSKDSVAPLLTQKTSASTETTVDPEGLDLAALLEGDVISSAIEMFSADTSSSITPDGTELDSIRDPKSIPNNLTVQKKLKEIIASLLSGQPIEENTAESINLRPGQIKNLVQIDAETLQGLINDKNASLIATGLSPEDLTKILDQIKSGEEATNTNGFLIALVKILPEKSAQQSVFIPKALALTKTTPSDNEENQEPSEGLSSSLNALIAGAETLPALSQKTGETSKITPETIDPESDPLMPINANARKEKGFDDVLKLIEQIQAKTAGSRPDGTPASGLEKAINNKTPDGMNGLGPLNSTIGAKFSAFLGDLAVGSSVNGYLLDGSGWSQHNPAIGTAPVTGAAQLANLVTQAQGATHAHPATQVVAATLVKSAASGESKSMTLRLDPPDLGRIEVHMQFTKDKTMKAHMVIEKPETLLMLQRDAQILERSLHEAGMDAGGNALSFELAAQDHDFNNHDRSGNGSGHEGGSKNETTDQDIIETTMTWYVDEETGFTRYNILA